MPAQQVVMEPMGGALHHACFRMVGLLLDFRAELKMQPG